MADPDTKPPTDPPTDPPPADPPPTDPPAGADAAALQQQLDTQATANEATVAALLQSTRDANPNIPADLISGANADEIAASVTAGKATVAAVVAANPPAKPGGGPGAPPRDLAPPGPPEGATGLQRIAWALNHPGPGSTQPPA